MWRGLAQGNTTSSASSIPIRSQRAVSCPVVELPNILSITELLFGDLSKERLWVFLYQAMILGDKTRGFFAEMHFSLSTLQVDAIATSVNAHGVFAEVGPLSVFVSNHVCLSLSFVPFDRWHA